MDRLIEIIDDIVPDPRRPGGNLRHKLVEILVIILLGVMSGAETWIALGMSAKKYREKHSISRNDSIRAHLTAKEADMLERLQHMDVGLVYAGLSFKDRQHRLEWYAWSKSQPALTAEKQPSLPAA